MANCVNVPLLKNKILWQFVKLKFMKITTLWFVCCNKLSLKRSATGQKLNDSTKLVNEFWIFPPFRDEIKTTFQNRKSLVVFLLRLDWSMLIEWRMIHQSKYLPWQLRAEPHHFMPTNGGQSRPPLLALRVTFRVLLDSPIPQVLLQGLQSLQDPTLQLTGCSEKDFANYICDHETLFALSPFWHWFDSVLIWSWLKWLLTHFWLGVDPF